MIVRRYRKLYTMVGLKDLSRYSLPTLLKERIAKDLHPMQGLFREGVKMSIVPTWQELYGSLAS